MMTDSLATIRVITWHAILCVIASAHG
jgi:hypothetical protein